MKWWRTWVTNSLPFTTEGDDGQDADANESLVFTEVNLKMAGENIENFEELLNNGLAEPGEIGRSAHQLFRSIAEAAF